MEQEYFTLIRLYDGVTTRIRSTDLMDLQSKLDEIAEEAIETAEYSKEREYPGSMFQLIVNSNLGKKVKRMMDETGWEHIVWKSETEITNIVLDGLFPSLAFYAYGLAYREFFDSEKDAFTEGIEYFKSLFFVSTALVLEKRKKMIQITYQN